MATKRRSAKRWAYMHTLNGKPANFAHAREWRGGEIAEASYIYFADVRRPVTLASSLRQIRRESALAIADAIATGNANWANPVRYGYVRVELPATSPNPEEGQ